MAESQVRVRLNSSWISQSPSLLSCVTCPPGLPRNMHVCSFVLQYSFSLTTFSPSGKLVQIEYALNAVAAGATSLGISATDGVVIATEKKLPSILVDESTVQKICMLTPNIGVVYSGMGPDYRVLVRKARKTAQAYHRLYNEHIPVAQLVRETAAVMQEFTRKLWTCAGICWVPAQQHRLLTGSTGACMHTEVVCSPLLDAGSPQTHKQQQLKHAMHGWAGQGNKPLA